METHLKAGGLRDAGSNMTALRSLKGVTSSKPRRLNASEIVSLRQAKGEISKRVRVLSAAHPKRNGA